MARGQPMVISASKKLMNSESLIGGIVGIAGTVLLYLVRWVATRGDRRVASVRAEAKQQQQIDESNTKLATALRDEMRRDNTELRNRQQATELKLAATEARLEDIRIDNEKLRRENVELKVQNAAQVQQLASQSEQLKRQSDRIGLLEEQVSTYQSDRLTLIDALRTSGIDIPPLTTDKKPGTGPLKGNR